MSTDRDARNDLPRPLNLTDQFARHGSETLNLTGSREGLLPCPSWCRLHAGHGFDDDDGRGRRYRYHEGEAARAQLSIDTSLEVGLVIEEVANGNAAVVSSSWLYLHAEDRRLTAHGARELARALETAAAALDRVDS